MRKCYKCGTDWNVHEHHVIPKHVAKYFGLKDTDAEGRVLLCGKCHNIIQCYIINWVLDFVKLTYNPDDEFFQKLKAYIKGRTEYWMGRGYG